MTKLRRIFALIAVLIASAVLTACAGGSNGSGDSRTYNPEHTAAAETDATAAQATPAPEITTAPETAAPEETEGVTSGTGQKFTVAIDAGHQQKGNSEKEPVGPGTAEMKAKVASGTSGCVSGLNEYELTLQVALKLQKELESRGYNVIMIRTSNNVDISNAERAVIANDAGADAFVRIHANGSEDPSVNGALTICQTPDNIYNGSLYSESRKLASFVLDEMVSSTGCKKQYIMETDGMSGINWAQVPVTIVEMGYMTNPEEDAKMATENYQTAIAEGIANGIDKFAGR